MKVYLAGPISGLTYDKSQEWRHEVAETFANHGVDAYSPLRSKQYLQSYGQLEGSYENHPLSCAKGILSRDRWDVMTADLVLVNLLGTERVSIGTVMEVAYADAFRKPIVLAVEQGNVHVHPMMTEAANFICSTLHDAVNVSLAVLLRDGK